MQSFFGNFQNRIKKFSRLHSNVSPSTCNTSPNQIHPPRSLFCCNVIFYFALNESKSSYVWVELEKRNVAWSVDHGGTQTAVAAAAAAARLITGNLSVCKAQNNYVFSQWAEALLVDYIFNGLMLKRKPNSNQSFRYYNHLQSELVFKQDQFFLEIKHDV